MDSRFRGNDGVGRGNDGVGRGNDGVAHWFSFHLVTS